MRVSSADELGRSSAAPVHPHPVPRPSLLPPDVLADQLAIGRTGTPSAVAAALSSGSGDDGAGPNGGSMYGNGGSSAAYQVSGSDGVGSWDTGAAAGLRGMSRCPAAGAQHGRPSCWAPYGGTRAFVLCLACDAQDDLRGQANRALVYVIPSRTYMVDHLRVCRGFLHRATRFVLHVAKIAPCLPP